MHATHTEYNSAEQDDDEDEGEDQDSHTGTDEIHRKRGNPKADHGSSGEDEGSGEG